MGGLVYRLPALQAGVVVQECHSSLADRITLAGNYSSHECGLAVRSLTVADAGEWRCSMEEYRSHYI